MMNKASHRTENKKTGAASLPPLYRAKN